MCERHGRFLKELKSQKAYFCIVALCRSNRGSPRNSNFDRAESKLDPKPFNFFALDAPTHIQLRTQQSAHTSSPHSHRHTKAHRLLILEHSKLSSL